MYYFIVNPNSRSGTGTRIWKDLNLILNSRNILYEAFFTEYAGHAVELAKTLSSRASATNIISLIAVGGDGTIQEVLSGITHLSHIRFGYIPTGSGNDFCRSMKLPQNPKEALESILTSDKTIPMDVAEITCGGYKSRFGVSCGIGFDAAVCHEVGISPLKKTLNRIGLGKLAYLLIGVKQLLFLPPAAISLESDKGKKYSFQKVFLTAVMNQKYEGGGFKFCPDADSSDQLLDVIIVEGMCRPKLIFCLFLSIFGHHTHFQGVHLFRCQKLTVKSDKALAIHKDGESSGFQKEFSVALAKESLLVIRPE